MKEELIQKFQAGNRQAGDDYYSANLGLVYNTARKYKKMGIDEEEVFAIVNQAFAYSLKNVNLEKAKFSTYFAIVAKGMILRHFRDCERNIRTQRRDVASRTIVHCDSLDEVVYKSEGKDITRMDRLSMEQDYTSAYVEEALNKLRKKDREAFKLQYLQELSQREIGEMCGCGQVEISRRIARAKASLRLILKEVS